jgi:hypothetical protein
MWAMLTVLLQDFLNSSGDSNHDMTVLLVNLDNFSSSPALMKEFS